MDMQILQFLGRVNPFLHTDGEEFAGKDNFTFLGKKAGMSGEESVNSCGDRWDLCQNLGIAHSFSHFQVELKSGELFQQFYTSLAPRPKPAQKNKNFPLEHAFSRGPPHLVDVRPSVWHSLLGASPKSSRLVEHWVDDRLESATIRSNLSPEDVSYAPYLNVTVRELSQIQVSSPRLNSLKFSILQIRPGPLSKCDLSITLSYIRCSIPTEKGQHGCKLEACHIEYFLCQITSNCQMLFW